MNGNKNKEGAHPSCYVVSFVHGCSSIVVMPSGIRVMSDRTQLTNFSLDLSELRSSIADRVKKLGELSKW